MEKRIVIYNLSLFFILMLCCTGALAETCVWEPASGDVTGYRLYYSKENGNFSTNVDVGNVTRYSLDALPLKEGITYYFAVTAYNAISETAFSQSAVWTPPDTTPPIPPTGLRGKD